MTAFHVVLLFALLLGALVFRRLPVANPADWSGTVFLMMLLSGAACWSSPTTSWLAAAAPIALSFMVGSYLAVRAQVPKSEERTKSISPNQGPPASGPIKMEEVFILGPSLPGQPQDFGIVIRDVLAFRVPPALHNLLQKVHIRNIEQFISYANINPGLFAECLGLTEEGVRQAVFDLLASLDAHIDVHSLRSLTAVELGEEGVMVHLPSVTLTLTLPEAEAAPEPEKV